MFFSIISAHLISWAKNKNSFLTLFKDTDYNSNAQHAHLHITHKTLARVKVSFSLRNSTKCNSGADGAAQV